MAAETKSPQEITRLLESLNGEAERILARYEQKRAALLPLLHLAQEHIGYVSLEAQVWAGKLVGIAPARVHEVVTFYTLFRQKPIGKYHLQVCTNMSCMLRGSDEILERCEQRLGIKAGQTTADGLFTLSSVECLCACDVAPMLQCNEKYIGPLTLEGVDDLIENCRKKKV